MFVQIKWNPSRRDIRNFGWTMLAGLNVVGGLLTWMIYQRSQEAGWGILEIFIGAGVGILLASVFLERTAGLWLYKAWMGLALILGKIMGPIVMGIFYFLVVTPIGQGARLLGRDSMQRKKAGHATFWHPLRHRTEPSSYERQF
ncbi:MAG: hypothetical protein NTV79_00120 [Candidatus Aureabacteria bacterium]|nr:hypothetical protein [Candidatus Auribacterota bacterium]